MQIIINNLQTNLTLTGITGFPMSFSIEFWMFEDIVQLSIALRGYLRSIGNPDSLTLDEERAMNSIYNAVLK